MIDPQPNCVRTARTTGMELSEAQQQATRLERLELRAKGAQAFIDWAKATYGEDWKKALAPPPGLCEQLNNQIAEERGWGANYFTKGDSQGE